jgi:hypothetical protein
MCWDTDLDEEGAVRGNDAPPLALLSDFILFEKSSTFTPSDVKEISFSERHEVPSAEGVIASVHKLRNMYRVVTWWN